MQTSLLAFDFLRSTFPPMLKRCHLYLWLKNPHGDKTCPFPICIPYRTERIMFKMCRGERYEVPTDRHLRHRDKYVPLGIPRDMGEIPRNYIIRHLFFTQPITATALWEILKRQPDVPLDSRRHLTLVLKMARLENWIYFEKNQDSNEWVCNITRDRYAEAQTLVREHKNDQRIVEEEKKEQEKKLHTVKTNELETLHLNRIQDLHWEMLNAAERMKRYDFKSYKALPFVNDSNQYDLRWYTSDPIPQ